MAFAPTTRLGGLALASARLIETAALVQISQPDRAAESLKQAVALQRRIGNAGAFAVQAELSVLEQGKSLLRAKRKERQGSVRDESDAEQELRLQSLAREARAIQQIVEQTDFQRQANPASRKLNGYNASGGVPRRILVPDRFDSEVDVPYFNAGSPPRVYDPVLATSLTMHAEGAVLPEDKAVIILLHGAGAVYSNSNALLGLMNDVAKMETAGGKKRAFATVAVDLPFHGFGARDPRLKDLSAYMQYLHGIVSRYTAYGKPVFLFGRSFGAISAVEYACRYRDIAGVIHMSGLHKDWAEENVANMHANGFGINQAGLDFAMAIARQLTYFDAGTTPLVGGLILQGLKDVEYDPAKQSALWPVLGQRLDYGVRLFADGEHNLFDSMNPAVHKAARAAVHEFMLERIGTT